jgi:hypothetical protein
MRVRTRPGTTSASEAETKIRNMGGTITVRTRAAVSLR